MPTPGITVLKHNAPWGPFTQAQIKDGLLRGDFTLSYLAHAPGLNQWLPLGEVLHYVGKGPDLPPLPGERNVPELPTTTAKVPPPLPPIPPKEKPVEPAPVVAEKPPAKAPEPEVHLEPAPFFRRGMAFAIDCCLLFLPVLIIFGISWLNLEIRSWWGSWKPQTLHEEMALLYRNFLQVLFLTTTGLGWLYGAGLESSRRQATVGKRWMGLKVTDLQGQRLGFLHATGRYAALYLSALPCFLGFLMALFGSRNLALHDRLAGTRVVRR